jgi:hypothetical protein
VCLIKATNPRQCRYLDGNCSLLIECCRAVGVIYTLKDGKRAKCSNHHKSLKKKINSFQEVDNTTEVENKTILMGHPILCCQALVVRSCFIHCKMIISP